MVPRTFALLTVACGALLSLVALGCSRSDDAAEATGSENDLVGGRGGAPPLAVMKNVVNVRADIYTLTKENFEAWVKDERVERKYMRSSEFVAKAVIVSPHVAVTNIFRADYRTERLDGALDLDEPGDYEHNATRRRGPLQVEIPGVGAVNVRRMLHAGGAMLGGYRHDTPCALWLSRAVQVPGGVDRVDLYGRPKVDEKVFISTVDGRGPDLLWAQVKVASLDGYAFTVRDVESTFWKRLFGYEDKVRPHWEDHGMPAFSEDGRLIGTEGSPFGDFTVIADTSTDGSREDFAHYLRKLVDTLEAQPEAPQEQ